MFKKSTVVIGIAGGSASGKSTFSEQLKSSLIKFADESSIGIMHMDEYFKPENERPRAVSPINGKCYIDDNHPQTMELDRFYSELKSMAENGKYRVLIAEGLMTLYDERIRGLCDIKLFVDCRADERIIRRIKRNMQWGQAPEQITDVYLNLVRIRHDEYVEPSKLQADLVVNGTMPFDMPINIIASYVRELAFNV